MLTVILICIASGMAVTASAECTEHTYDDNGFCTTEGCGAYEPATLTNDYDLNDDKKTEEAYKIDNAGKLYWFAGLVNGDTSVCDYDAETNPTGIQQNSAANAVVTSHIQVNDNIVADDVNISEYLYVSVNGSDTLRSWTPIGNSQSNAYTGIFHGGNGISYARNRIEGLYFRDKEAVCAGLFGFVGEGGTVRNVDVKGSFFYAQTYMGGICGYNAGTLKNCDNLSYLITLGERENNCPASIGGICGYNTGTINNCCNDVEGANTGTVISYNIGESTMLNAPCIGGICGYNYNGGKILNSTNKGSVNGYSRAYMIFNIGGICGYAADNTDKSEITNCSNLAEITINETDRYLKTTYLQLCAGGVCGYDSGVALENNYNTADINIALSEILKTSYQEPCYIGGFCGYTLSDGNFINCYNNGNININASKLTTTENYKGNIYVGGLSGYWNNNINKFCYSSAKITITDNAEAEKIFSDVVAVGGLGGCLRDSYYTDIESCYYDGDLLNVSAFGNEENTESVKDSKKTTNQFKSGEVAYLLQKDQPNDELGRQISVYGQSLSKGDRYPTFGTNAVYQTIGCTAGYSNTENTEKEHEHNLANEYVCACGDKVTKLVVSTNETSSPELTADTVLYEKDSTTASDFKYDGTSKVTTVYVRIYNPTTDAKPVIKIEGDKGNVDSDTWTAATGKSIYCAQFIGDFADFGTIKVTYGSDTVTVPTTTSTEEEL